MFFSRMISWFCESWKYLFFTPAVQVKIWENLPCLSRGSGLRGMVILSIWRRSCHVMIRVLHISQMPVLQDTGMMTPASFALWRMLFWGCAGKLQMISLLLFWIVIVMVTLVFVKNINEKNYNQLRFLRICMFLRSKVCDEVGMFASF